jgi:hypothetical protein
MFMSVQTHTSQLKSSTSAPCPVSAILSTLNYYRIYRNICYCMWLSNREQLSRKSCWTVSRKHKFYFWGTERKCLNNVFTKLQKIRSHGLLGLSSHRTDVHCFCFVAYSNEKGRGTGSHCIEGQGVIALSDRESLHWGTGGHCIEGQGAIAFRDRGSHCIEGQRESLHLK